MVPQVSATVNAGAVNWVIQSDGGVIASFPSGTSQQAFTTLSIDLLSSSSTTPVGATSIIVAPNASTIGVSNATATSPANALPSSDSGMPQSTKIALGVAIPLVILAIGISLFFFIYFRRRYRRRNTTIAPTMEVDSDEVHEVETKEKPAELSQPRSEKTHKRATMMCELDASQEVVLQKDKLVEGKEDMDETTSEYYR